MSLQDFSTLIASLSRRAAAVEGFVRFRQLAPDVRLGGCGTVEGSRRTIRSWMGAREQSGHRTLAPRVRPDPLTCEPEITRLYFIVSLARSKKNSMGSAGGWLAMALSSG